MNVLIRVPELKEYYEKITKYEVFSSEKLESLYREYKTGNMFALEEIVSSYLRLVVDITLKFGSQIQDEKIMDAIRAGNVGLRYAVAQYNEDKNNFEVFLLKEIRGAIAEFLSLNSKENFVDDKPFFFPNELHLDEEHLAVLKSVMEGEQYYCFYGALNGIKQNDIAKALCETPKTVLRLQKEALEIFKIYCDKTSPKYRSALKALTLAHSKQDVLFNIRPLSVIDIIKYLFIRSQLTSDELALFQYRTLKNRQYNVDELCHILKISRLKYTMINKSLITKLGKVEYDEGYLAFKEDMTLKYGKELYHLIEEQEKVVQYEAVKATCDALSLVEIEEALKDQEVVSLDEMNLIRRYYTSPSLHIHVEAIERELNLQKFGYKKKNNRIPDKMLYETLRKYRDWFNEEQILFLECFYFKLKDKKEFYQKFPDSLLHYRYYYLIDRLEKLAFGIFNILENTFTKDKYLIVRKKYADRLTDERVAFLDLFYGIAGKAYTIKEIALMYEMDYIKCHDIISDAREYCINLYNNMSARIDISKEEYVSYLHPKYEYAKGTREILRMFLVEEVSYEEISQATGLNKTRISNIITEAIRKLDFYRFGINEVRTYSEEELRDILGFFPDKFTKTDKDVLCLRFLEYKENKDIAKSLGLQLAEVNKIIGRFYKIDLDYKIRNVTLTLKDVEDEINRHVTESLIGEGDKVLLSFYYGIQNQYNPLGEKLTSLAICDKVGIDMSAFYRYIRKDTILLKGRKVGCVKPDLNYIPRNELESILQDRHVPISDKERDIICHLFELDGHVLKNLDELSEMYGENNTSLRRRYQRAILSIKKYQRGEIEGKIDYEEDLVPILKYFSDSDREVIGYLFKDNLSVQQIAKKYKISIDRMRTITNRIRRNIYGLLFDSDTKRFDFDYYKVAIQDERLPFYGNLRVVTKIFDLFFGMESIERQSALEIIRTLNLETKTSAINNSIYCLMLSVCKLRMGIYKDKEPNYERVLAYYEAHKDEMLSTHKVYYQRYFSRMNNTKTINGIKSLMSDYILYDLILDEYGDACIRLENLEANEALKIIKTTKLPRFVKEGLMSYFGFTGKEMMNGRELNHFYKLMHYLIKQRIITVNPYRVLEKK